MANDIKDVILRSYGTLFRDAVGLAGLFAMLFGALHLPVLT